MIALSFRQWMALLDQIITFIGGKVWLNEVRLRNTKIWFVFFGNHTIRHPRHKMYCVSQRAEPAERCAYSRNPRWIIRKPLFVKVMQKQIQLFPSSTPSHQKSSFYYVRGTQIMVLLASIFHILLEMSSWLWKQLIMSLQLGNCCLGKQQITICTFCVSVHSFPQKLCCWWHCNTFHTICKKFLSKKPYSHINNSVCFQLLVRSITPQQVVEWCVIMWSISGWLIVTKLRVAHHKYELPWDIKLIFCLLQTFLPYIVPLGFNAFL